MHVVALCRHPREDAVARRNGVFTAVGLAIAAVALTPLVFFLPKATLAATIVVAVLSLVDFSILAKAWRYSKADFAAVAATLGVTLAFGVELGVRAVVDRTGATGARSALLVHFDGQRRAEWTRGRGAPREPDQEQRGQRCTPQAWATSSR